MASRFIADNGLAARLVMDLSQRFKLPGVGLLLDQKKAYDRVHPQYLRACLQRFGFPGRVISCLSSLFFDTTICINVNGYLSAPLSQDRGLRQGDPLSPLLFNIALEPLLRALLGSNSLPGFNFQHSLPHTLRRPPGSSPTLKALAYADDILVFLSQPTELPPLLRLISLYERVSNARLNRDKTVAVSLSGTSQPGWRQTLGDHGITQWHDSSSATAATYLGFPLTSSTQQLDR